MTKHPVHVSWMVAILHAQESGDTGALVKLLSDAKFELRRGERLLLARLLASCRLTKPRGGQFTPIGKLDAEA
jgi:hypothetical protein